MAENGIFKTHRVDYTGLALMGEITNAYSEALAKIDAAIRAAGGSSDPSLMQRAIDKLEESCMLARKAVAVAHKVPERMSDLQVMPPQLDKVAP